MRLLLRLGAMLCLGSLAAPAAAAVCSVAAQGVSFGNYDPLSGSVLDGGGNINVTCDTPAPFTVSLGTGSSGSFAERRIASGTSSLRYNLYSDVARTSVWGDGVTAGNVSGTGTNVDLPIYGRMPALQNVAPDTYADTITVTITY